MPGLMRFISARTALTLTSISDEIDADILNTTARHRLLFIEASALRHSFNSSLWSLGCLT